jgi:hypothetical protein
LVALASAGFAQLQNETLLVELPTGYQIGFQDQKGNMRMSEMVPASETVDDTSEMVTVQIFSELKTPPAPFRDNIQKGWLAACKDGGAHAVSDARENGYATLTWVLSCPRNPSTGKPEITWFKAVRGNDSFYAVQKAFRFMPAQEQMTGALAYLNMVKVCDTRRKDSPCPRTRN